VVLAVATFAQTAACAFVYGVRGLPVVGTPEQVVEGVGRLHGAAMEGMIMGFR
jgi:hypothetical protein